MSSWQMSGSGVYSGRVWCRMYCVEKNTRYASPFKKSRADSKPPTGRSVNPVCVFRKSEMSCSCGMLVSLYPQCFSSSGSTVLYASTPN